MDDALALRLKNKRTIHR